MEVHGSRIAEAEATNFRSFLGDKCVQDIPGSWLEFIGIGMSTNLPQCLVLKAVLSSCKSLVIKLILWCFWTLLKKDYIIAIEISYLFLSMNLRIYKDHKVAIPVDNDKLIFMFGISQKQIYDCVGLWYNCTVKVKSLSRVQLFATPWTIAYQAPPSMGFSKQEHWSGLPFSSPGDLPDPRIEPGSPTLEADALTSEPPGKPHSTAVFPVGLG